jgi:hypothetical protein
VRHVAGASGQDTSRFLVELPGGGGVYICIFYLFFPAKKLHLLVVVAAH